MKIYAGDRNFMKTPKKKTPITFREGAAAFTIGAGIGGIASKSYDSATGYERKRVKKQKKG